MSEKSEVTPFLASKSEYGENEYEKHPVTLPLPESIKNSPLVENIFSSDAVSRFHVNANVALADVLFSEDNGMEGITIVDREKFNRTVESSWSMTLAQFGDQEQFEGKVQTQMILFDIWMADCNNSFPKPHQYLLRSSQEVQLSLANSTDTETRGRILDFEQRISQAICDSGLSDITTTSLSPDELLEKVDIQWQVENGGDISDVGLKNLYTQWQKAYLDIVDKLDVAEYPEIVAAEVARSAISILKKIKTDLEEKLDRKHILKAVNNTHALLFSDVANHVGYDAARGQHNQPVVLNREFVEKLRERFNPDLIYIRLGEIHDAILLGLEHFYLNKDEGASIADSITTMWNAGKIDNGNSSNIVDGKILSFILKEVEVGTLFSKYKKLASVRAATSELQKARGILEEAGEDNLPDTLARTILEQWGIPNAEIDFFIQNPKIFKNYYTSFLQYGPFLAIRQTGLPVWAAAGIVANLPGVREHIKEYDALSMTAAVAALTATMLLRGRANYKTLLNTGVTPDLIAQTGYLGAQLSNIAENTNGNMNRRNAKVGAVTGELASTWYVVNPATLIPITALDYPIGFVTYAASVAFNFLLEAKVVIPEEKRDRAFKQAEQIGQRLKERLSKEESSGLVD